MKRSRTTIVKGAKRPVDKALITINDVIDNSQTNTGIYTATQAVTYSGAVIDLSFLPQTTSTATASYLWALIYIPEGRTANALAFSGGSTSYNPEQDVLAIGSGGSVYNSTTQVLAGFNHIHIVLKSKRKMKEGDTIVLANLGSGANVGTLVGTVSLFVKQ